MGKSRRRGVIYDLSRHSRTSPSPWGTPDTQTLLQHPFGSLTFDRVRSQRNPDEGEDLEMLASAAFYDDELDIEDPEDPNDEGPDTRTLDAI